MRLVLFLLLILLNPCIKAQKPENVKPNKGKIYALWGWNRGWYSKSDIRFQGNDYDFKLDDVEATDRQTPFSYGTYFGPKTITIPQTNFRIGYYINENIYISFGVDHMKYVMVANQESNITGKIENETDFSGVYNYDEITLTQNFIRYEHTDGLNYLNIEITYNQNLLQLIRLKSNPNKIELNYLLGFGLGAMMPKSNVTLMDNDRYDDFHFSGYGFSAKVGINLTFYRFFFIRTEYKGGFTHLTDVKTTQFESDRARQHFLFTQLNFCFGIAINPFN
jgi:hypothetical protein